MPCCVTLGLDGSFQTSDPVLPRNEKEQKSRNTQALIAKALSCGFLGSAVRFIHLVDHKVPVSFLRLSVTVAVAALKKKISLYKGVYLLIYS